MDREHHALLLRFVRHAAELGLSRAEAMLDPLPKNVYYLQRFASLAGAYARHAPRAPGSGRAVSKEEVEPLERKLNQVAWFLRVDAEKYGDFCGAPAEMCQPCDPKLSVLLGVYEDMRRPEAQRS
jgi:hypothetical protein